MMLNEILLTLDEMINEFLEEHDGDYPRKVLVSHEIFAELVKGGLIHKGNFVYFNGIQLEATDFTDNFIVMTE